MNKADIKEMLEGAASELLKNQEDFFKFTSATNQTEWNITYHYANEVRKLFPEYNCDIDVSKPNLGNKRPDIIIHIRGGHKGNFLVIEVKRDKKDIPEEKQKIHSFWFQDPLKYEFGAVVVINEHETSSATIMMNESRKVGKD